MIILGLDLETGNPFKGEDGEQTKHEDSWITEFGAALYDSEIGQIPMEMYSTLINEGRGVSEEAQKYTGITSQMVEKYGKDPQEVALKVMDLLRRADYVVAHNGREFDKPKLFHFLKRHLGAEGFEGFEPPHWIDSMTDIEYPETMRSKNLTFLAGAHLILNSFPHRALTDVLTMMTIFFRYDFERTLKVSRSPQIILKALAPIDLVTCEKERAVKRKLAFKAGTEEYREMEKWKGIIKERGFRWDASGGETGEKCWYKKTREIFLQEGREDIEGVKLVKMTSADDVF